MARLVLGCGKSETSWDTDSDHERSVMLAGVRAVLGGGSAESIQDARHVYDPSEPTWAELSVPEQAQLGGFRSRIRAQSIALGYTPAGSLVANVRIR